MGRLATDTVMQERPYARSKPGSGLAAVTAPGKERLFEMHHCPWMSMHSGPDLIQSPHHGILMYSHIHI